MKKFTRVILIITLILVALGNLMYWGTKIYRHIRSGEIYKSIGSRAYEVTGEVNRIKVSAQYAVVKIYSPGEYDRKADDDVHRCYLENVDISRSEVYIENGVLLINAFNAENMEVLGWNAGDVADTDKDARVTLWLSKEEYDSIIIDTGTGSIDTGRIDCRDLIIQLGAGNVTSKALKTENGAIQTGVGSVDIKKLESSPNLSVKTGAGNIDIIMAAASSEYDVSVKTGAGNISVFGDSYFGIDNKIIKRGTGEKKLDLETGTGWVTVR